MKTKLPLVALFLAVAAFLRGSDSFTFNRLYIGIGITPDVSYRYLNKNFVPSGNSEAQVQGIISDRNSHDFPEVGVMGGVKIGVYLTHWLAIESGLQYNMQRFRYSSNTFYAAPYAVNSPLADSFTTVDRNTYHYLDIPLALNFSIGKKKVRGIISAGVNFDFLLRKGIYYTYTYADGRVVSGREVDNYNSFNTFNLSPFLGIGADFYCTKSFIIRIMPQAQMQALKNINAPVTEYLWNAGLNVSFMIGFLKNK
jgi:hypothetical protein